MVSLFIAVPCGSCKMYTACARSLMNLQKECISRGIQAGVFFEEGNSLLPHARNKLASAFLESGMDYMLFVDDDIEFSAEAVIAMMSCNKDMIGGMYPYKTYNWNAMYEAARQPYDSPDEVRRKGVNYVFRALQASQSIHTKQEPIEVEAVGTGLLLIHRRALERMVSGPNPVAPRYTVDAFQGKDGEVFYNFFQVQLDGGVLISEDYWFCRQWRKCGGQIYAATWALCKHWGIHTFGA